MRVMYDSVNPAAIPAGADLVAGYISGRYAWSQADWARFPGAVQVHIATQATVIAGHVLDVEAGDATPTQAVAWVIARRAAGADPTVYCNTSTWPAVRAAFAVANVAPPHYWVARYDGVPALPPGAVAKQHTTTNGWDESSVADYWPGVDTPGGAVMSSPELPALYQQHAGPGAAVGAYPGWPVLRYLPAPNTPGSLTLLDYARHIDRECNSRLAASSRSTSAARPDLDTLFGHVVSVHAVVEQVLAAVTAVAGALSAEQAALLAAIKAVPAEQVNVNEGALAEQLGPAVAAALIALLNKAATG